MTVEWAVTLHDGQTVPMDLTASQASGRVCCACSGGVGLVPVGETAAGTVRACRACNEALRERVA